MFNRQDHLSITGDSNFDGDMSVDEFMENMPPDLQRLKHSKFPLGTREYVVFSQQDLYIFDLSPVSSPIKQRIEWAFTKLQISLWTFQYGLVQFWSPVSIVGRQYLITTELPFYIMGFDRGLCSYRKQCMGYRYSADWEDAHTGHLFGPPGRVFLTGIAEATNILHYSIHEHPLRDYAVTCKGTDNIFIPVYETQGVQCIGVVEYISFQCQYPTAVLLEYLIGNSSNAFQSENLMLKDVSSTFSDDSSSIIELELALKHVCQRQYIPFAQVWVPTRDLKTNYIVYSVIQQEWRRRNNFSISFYKKCKRLKLKEREGVIGKAFSSLSSCFCGNLSQLSTDVYPLGLHALQVDLISSFAVCLRHSTSGYKVFILEFFFSNSQMTSSETLELVRSVLETIKHESPYLRQASGQQLEAVDIQILSPFPDEVVNVASHNPASNNSYHPVEITIAEVPTEKEFPQNGGEVFRSPFEQPAVLAPHDLRGPEMIRSDQLLVENAHNIDIMQKDVDDITPLHNDQAVIAPHDPSEADMMLFEDLDQPSAGDAHNIDRPLKDVGGIGPPVNDLDMEVRITREVLEQHAVAKLELVARHLEVSRSTFKRICRKHGIKNWRSFTKSMVNRMHPESSKAAEEHIKHGYCRTEDEGFSLFKGNNSSGEIVESVPKKTRIQNGNNVTVKATYESGLSSLLCPNLQTWWKKYQRDSACNLMDSKLSMNMVIGFYYLLMKT